MEKLRNKINKKIFEIQEDMNKEWCRHGDTKVYRTLESDLEREIKNLENEEKRHSKRLEWCRREARLAGLIGQRCSYQVTHDSWVFTQDSEVKEVDK